MARKTHTYTRGTSTYRMTQLGGFEVAEIATVVLNMAAELAPLIMSVRSDLGELDVSKVQLDWVKLRPIIQALSASCILVGKGGAAKLDEVFDEHFAGDLDGIVELLQQGLVLNFADFLRTRLGLDLAELWAKVAQSASISQESSTGTAGD